MPPLQDHELKHLYESVAGLEAIVETTKETYKRARKPKVDTKIYFLRWVCFTSTYIYCVIKSLKDL